MPPLYIRQPTAKSTIFRLALLHAVQQSLSESGKEPLPQWGEPRSVYLNSFHMMRNLQDDMMRNHSRYDELIAGSVTNRMRGVLALHEVETLQQFCATPLPRLKELFAEENEEMPATLERIHEHFNSIMLIEPVRRLPEACE